MEERNTRPNAPWLTLAVKKLFQESTERPRYVRYSLGTGLWTRFVITVETKLWVRQEGGVLEYRK